MVYIENKADKKQVDEIIKRIGNIKTDSLVMGHQSLIECLIRKGWHNPFPKVRCTERPDAACASILEGSIIVLCDNSPEALILPTSIFDFLQDTDDYYFPIGTIACLSGVMVSLNLSLVPSPYETIIS